MKFAPLYAVERDAMSGPARRAVREFLESGERGVVHSERGLLLHHICNHCLEARIGFTLVFDAVRQCYVIKRAV